MAEEGVNPIVSTDNPEGGTEFGGVSGLIPPASVHEPDADERLMMMKAVVRRRRSPDHP